MKRYHFRTRSVGDCRPLIFNPAYPWWHTGTAGDASYASIVAYLPDGEPLSKYWDDAYDIDSDEEEITFSPRFPRPDYYQEAQNENTN